jgi:hypothetical protein
MRQNRRHANFWVTYSLSKDGARSKASPSILQGVLAREVHIVCRFFTGELTP